MNYSIKTNTKNKGKEQVIDDIWLNYFNDVLYNKGIITESERNHIKNKISKRKK